MGVPFLSAIITSQSDLCQLPWRPSSPPPRPAMLSESHTGDLPQAACGRGRFGAEKRCPVRIHLLCQRRPSLLLFQQAGLTWISTAYFPAVQLIFSCHLCTVPSSPLQRRVRFQWNREKSTLWLLLRFYNLIDHIGFFSDVFLLQIKSQPLRYRMTALTTNGRTERALV